MAQLLTPEHPSYLEKLQELLEHDVLDLPFANALDIAYQKHYLADQKFEDCSFIVTHEDTPALGMVLTKDHERFSSYGRPARFLQNKNTAFLETKKSEKPFRKYIEKLLSENSDAEFLYSDFLNGGSANILTDILLTHGYKARSQFYQLIDLTRDEDILWRSVRDSYRSLINWGLENITLTIKDSTSVTADDFEAFRALHIQEAGRETRSKETWDIQLQQVQAGEGFLVLGHMDEELITAGLFLHSKSYCYYGVSASNRAMFEKPLSHALLWNAIKHSKTLGCTSFEMGDILYPVHDGVSDDKKVQGISTFKRGFGGQTMTKLSIIK